MCQPRLRADRLAHISPPAALLAIGATLLANPSSCALSTAIPLPLHPPPPSTLTKPRAPVAQMLDHAAEQQPQLTNLEVVVLASTVAISAVSPWLVTVNIAEVCAATRSKAKAALGATRPRQTPRPGLDPTRCFRAHPPPPPAQDEAIRTSFDPQSNPIRIRIASLDPQCLV